MLGDGENVSWRTDLEISVVSEHLNIVTPVFSNTHPVIRPHL